MPEIPEIETVRWHLEQNIQGKEIKGVLVNRAKAINVPIEQFGKVLHGQQIVSVRRRAKQLILAMTNHHSLIIHFMLEGYIRLFYPQEEITSQASVMLDFDTGERLGFFKITLGYIHLVDTINLAEMDELANLGPEPLDNEFTLEKFQELLAHRKGMIKPVLMDQSFLAGIGNVYSNEVLFCCRILPTRKVKDITEAEKEQIYHCIRDILTQAVKLGGVYDEVFSANDTLTGGFESRLQVAYRTGKPCFVCGNLIVTKRVGGRNAFFCPICQK